MIKLWFKRLDHCLESFIIRRDHGIYKLIRSYYLFKLWQTCPSWFQKKQRELVYRSCSSADNQDKGHDLNIASLALSKLPFGILTFSQFSLKVMQNSSKDVCCLSGRGQLQTDRELSTPNCHTARSTRSLPSQFTELLGTTNLVVWKGCNMAKFITNSVCYFQSSIV